MSNKKDKKDDPKLTEIFGKTVDVSMTEIERSHQNRVPNNGNYYFHDTDRVTHETDYQPNKWGKWMADNIIFRNKNK